MTEWCWVLEYAGTPFLFHMLVAPILFHLLEAPILFHRLAALLSFTRWELTTLFMCRASIS